jgi:hypothetical protein
MRRIAPVIALGATLIAPAFAQKAEIEAMAPAVACSCASFRQ